MIHAIVFFHGPSKLVLFDQVLIISLDRRRGDEANLLMTSHHLLIDVKRRCVVLFQRALTNKALEVLSPFGINARIVDANLVGHVYFGLVDMQKAERVVFC